MSRRSLKKKLKILVCNDDGVHSKGIHVLADALREIGEVYVVAPDRERSAAGHALTLHKPLRVEPFGKRIFAINGTPTDCVNLGVRLMRSKPDLVVSGINKGENLGEDITYSGTVSAAMEGILLDIPSFAISLMGSAEYRFDTAAQFARQLSLMILKKGLPKGTLLNVNVPNLPAEKIRGVKLTTLGKRVYQDVIVEKVDPRGKKYYWIAGKRIVFEGPRNSDFKAVQAARISVTPLKLDLTDHRALKRIKSWESSLTWA